MNRQMNELDKRINPYRSDLAAIHLKGKVDSKRFVEGESQRIKHPSVGLRKDPCKKLGFETELLFGEQVLVFENSNDGWSWVQNQSDNYVGWLPTESLESNSSVPTHKVSALRTFLYPEPEIRSPAIDSLSMGSILTVEEELEIRGNNYAVLKDGRAVVKNHICPIGEFLSDHETVAIQFIGTPYLWGGRTSIGLDCSALVQLSLNSCGLECPRDSDMQENFVGNEIEIPESLSSLIRGDLIFWKGHVAIVMGNDSLLHANGHTMTVAKEPLQEVVDRIYKFGFGPITSIRRP